MPTSSTGITIYGTQIGLGTKQIVEIPITTGLNGTTIKLVAHVIVGDEPGPVLCIMNTIHGGEWYAMEPLRSIRDNLETSQLTGAVIIVPVVNPAAFALDIRNVPDQVDSPDMNRIFPGPLTSTGDQIVAALTEHLISNSDALIDFHMGPKGAAFTDALTGSDFPAEVSKRGLELALAFGSPIVRHAPMISGFPGPKSSKPYAAAVLGIPGFGGEVGGAGFGPKLDAVWHRRTVDGIHGVMAAMGILESAPDHLPTRQLVYRNAHRINPRVGGVLRPELTGFEMGVEVKEGQVLGRITSPYTGEVLEELQSPADGLAYYVGREHPVYPGGWAFGLAQIDDDARWVTNEKRGS